MEVHKRPQPLGNKGITGGSVMQLVAGISVCVSLSKMNVARFESHQPILAHTMMHCCFKTLLLTLSDLSLLLPSRSALRLTWQKKGKKRKKKEEERNQKYSSRAPLFCLEEREVCSAAGSTSWNFRVLIKIDWLSEFCPYSPVFSSVFSQTVPPGVQAQW